MIRLTDATVAFASSASENRVALSEASVSVRSGEWVAVVGANGSGKTTLLRAIAGLVPLDSGSLQFDGDSKPRIAMLLQEPDNQFVTSSVLNELSLSVSAVVSPPEQRQRVVAAAKAYALADLAGRNPHRLSGGEKQRLALATVWLQQPDIVLLDEPIAFLDPEMTTLCVEFISTMQQNGAAVLWATPGGDDLAFAERVVFLEEGAVKFDGSLEEFYRWAHGYGAVFEPPALRALAEEIGAGIGLKLDIASMEDVETLAGGLAAAGIGSAGVDSPRPREQGDPAAVFEEVSFAYGDRPVLEELNVRVAECLGVTGPNASGKTTLLLLAAGAREPTAGRIVRRDADDGLRRRVVYIPQSPERMFFAETVAEELAFGPRQIGMDSDDIARRSAEALAAVGFDPSTMLHRPPLELSAGEMRRVAFAVALALNPHFVLFDEPTAGLDHNGRRVFLDIVAGFRARKATVAIASHDTALLCEACDNILFLGDRAVETTVELINGETISGWPPGNQPPILELQDELESKHGIDVRPRAVTASRFTQRVGRSTRD